MSANVCQVPGYISVRSLSAPDLDPGTRHIFSTLTPNRSSLHLAGRMDTFRCVLLGLKSGYDYEVQFRLFKGLHSLCDVEGGGCSSPGDSS